MKIQTTINAFRSPLLCGICLPSFLLVPFASAAVIVQDRFDSGYVHNTQLDGAPNPGGIGWDTNVWTKTGSAAATYQNSSFFTGSTAPAGGTTSLAGGSINKAAVHAGGNSRLTTDLSANFAAGETVWFSYLVAVRGSFTGQFDMGFANSATTASGIGISISGEQMHARINNTLSTASISTPLSADGFSVGGNNLSYYVVGQFNKGSSTGNDSLNVWVNQGTTLDLNAPTMSISGQTLSGTPDRFSFNSLASPELGGTNHIAIWADEIKLAPDSGSLGLTVIPEPSSNILIMLGICFSLARRKR